MKKPVIFLAILSIAYVCHSQESSFLKRINNQFNEFKRSHPSEKVYLHLDRPYYKPGEDIWFTAYLVNANTNKPSGISQIVYVDLINETGEVEQNLYLSTSNGKARGDFKISKHLNNGNYFIRAYTNWMKNEGEKSFFYKEIPIQTITKNDIILHTKYDKEYFLPGEKVSGKVWITDLEMNPIREEEFTLNILSNERTVFSEKDSTEFSGFSNVSFVLPEDSDSCKIDLNVTIDFNGELQSISSKVPVSSGIIDLQFFPEGGDLINNVNSKVAFKAINELGKGVEVEGSIKDENGNIIAGFSSFYKGMGTFSFTPNIKENYKAFITKPIGIEITFSLPEIKSSGYRLAIDEQKDKDSIYVSIHSPSENVIYLVGQQKEQIRFKKEINAKANENKISIPIKSLPIGIFKFTLFDETENEVCERLAFVNKHKQLKVKISTEKESYAAREKVEMIIKTYDNDGNSVPANLSLSVHEQGEMLYQDNILSYLHMSSELKGHIEDPAWYFSNDPKADDALDNVMLTHGWRRFTSQHVMNNVDTNMYFAEKLNTISGTVTNRKGRPIKNPTVFIQHSRTKITTPVKGDIFGRFTYNGWDGKSKLNFYAENWYSYGNNWLIEIDDDYKTNLVDEKYVVKMIDRVLSEAKSNTNVFEEMLSKNQGSMLETLNIEMEQEIIFFDVTEVIAYREIKPIDLGAGEYIPKGTISKFPAPDFASAIQGKSAGVHITRNSGAPGAQYKFLIRGTGSINNNDPLFVVDGVSTERMPDIAPDDVASITILKDADACAIYGNRGANGVVIINTKRGENLNHKNYDEQFGQKSYINENDAKIFDNVREFYSPNYDVVTISNGNDLRPTLYWNPEINTNNKGIAKISFYTSDAITDISTVAEGFSNYGLVGAEEYVFQTK